MFSLFKRSLPSHSRTSPCCLVIPLSRHASSNPSPSIHPATPPPPSPLPPSGTANVAPSSGSTDPSFFSVPPKAEVDPHPQAKHKWWIMAAVLALVYANYQYPLSDSGKQMKTELAHREKWIAENELRKKKLDQMSPPGNLVEGNPVEAEPLALTTKKVEESEEKGLLEVGKESLTAAKEEVEKIV